MPFPLTSQEEQVLAELGRLAGNGRVITAKQLRNVKFAEFVFNVYRRDVAYPDAQQNRVLQELRNKGYINMEHGRYTIIDTPCAPPETQS